MSKFWQVTEDPSYNEDGQLAEDELLEVDLGVGEEVFARIVEELSPFQTANS